MNCKWISSNITCDNNKLLLTHRLFRFNKVGLSPSTQLPTLYGSSGSSSGGYLEYILVYAARELFGVNDLSSNIHVQTAKNVDFTEYTLKNDEGKALLRFASAYGFRNIQNVVRKVKNNKCSYHFVEVMACPGGCINGGGQLPATVTSEPTNLSAKDWITHVENIYRSVEGIRPEDNEVVRSLYRYVHITSCDMMTSITSLNLFVLR